MRYRLVIKLCPLLLVLLAASCERRPLEYQEQEEAPVRFSLETKALGAGEKTFRVALFNNMTTQTFLAQGTYCNRQIDHSATVSGGVWISPCRVNNAGGPLKADGTEASSLTEADTDSKWGLRSGSNGSCYLAAVSPAIAFSIDAPRRYLQWTPTGELYVSEAVFANLSGSWLNGEYVYKSSAALTLKDRRARIYVHIECGELSTAYIQSVTLLNCVTSARWYLTSGFSTSNYSTGSYSLFDYASNNNGAVLHLVKADSDEWTSTAEVFLPSIDYSDTDNAPLRPQIQILMGNDPAHPSTAVVDITAPVEPMKNYTYNLYVSKSEVVITLTTVSWDDGGSHSSVDTEEPGRIGSVSIDAWTDGGSSSSDNWNTSFD